MAMTVDEFRQEAAQRRGSRRRGTLRYPEAMVSFAVAHARGVRAAGGSVNAAALQLGLSAMTLGSWLSRSEHGGRGQLREVVVSESAPRVAPQGLTVTTRLGHVVSGLDVAQAAALLRALS